MRILTGDECGLLKETIPEHCRPKQDAFKPNSNNKAPLSTLDGVRRVDPHEQQRRARGVIDMSFTSNNDDSSSSFAALRANGTIQLWESTRDVPKESFGSYQCTGVVSNVFEKAGENESNTTNNDNKGRPIALDSLVQEERLCAADSLGNIVVIRNKALSPPTVVATYSPFSKQAQQQQTLSYTKGSYANTSMCTAMAVDPIPWTSCSLWKRTRNASRGSIHGPSRVEGQEFTTRSTNLVATPHLVHGTVVCQ